MTMRNIAALAMQLLLLQTVLLAVKSLSLVPVVHRGQEQSHYDRRAFIANTVFTTSCSFALLQPPSPAFAADPEARGGRNGKPFAPLEALLPATRLKLWLDEVYKLSKELSTSDQTQQQRLLLQQINNKLSNPPHLFHGEQIPKRTTASTVAQLTTSISSANKGQYKLNRTGLNLNQKVMAMANQADVERQWGMLQYAESKREEGNEMRAAFNFYSRQLNFSEEYVLTAPKEKRREMIRNDALPSVTDVIGSDLDRRDLYRNTFLTAIDDAVAEAAYQVRLKPEEMDVTDLKVLVSDAWEACGNWFSLIDERDVEEAVAAVVLEDGVN